MIGVDVGPVEGEVDPVDGLPERLGVVDEARIVEAEEPNGAVGLVEVGGAGARERHPAPADRPPRVDDAMDGAVGGERLRSRRRLVGGVRRPRVRALQLLHRQALALVEV